MQSVESSFAVKSHRQIAVAKNYLVIKVLQFYQKVHQSPQNIFTYTNS